MTALSIDGLNRATLARQGLLDRSPSGALGMVTQLVGLQSQAPNPPYTGLWSRVQGFAFDDLARLLQRREVVRIVTLRGTVHLHTAEDARWLRPLTQQAILRQFSGNHARRISGFDPVIAEARARERLADGPATGPELAEALAEQWPGAPREALSNAARCLLPLVQVPPRGIWGQSGQPTYALLDEWIGRPLTTPTPEEALRRYLAAFGPATIKDAQAWCGITRLKAAADRLGDALVTLTGPAGETLFDLRDAPRPPADVSTPVRLLPEWDNLLIGYADRSRVIDPAHRAAIFTSNGIIPGTVLVGGRVAATYRITPPTKATDGACTITPLRPLASGVVDDIADETSALLAAMGAPSATVTFSGRAG